jgi:hypothetical protein
VPDHRRFGLLPKPFFALTLTLTLIVSLAACSAITTSPRHPLQEHSP